MRRGEQILGIVLRAHLILLSIAAFPRVGLSAAGAVNRPPTLEVAAYPVAYNKVTDEDIIRTTVKVGDPDGDGVTLDFRVYDAQGRIGQKEVKLYSSEETITKTFSFRQPGTYDLFIQASDGKIAVQWHQSVVITGNRPPTLTVRRGEPIWDEAQKVHRLEVNVQIVDPDAGDSIAGDLQIKPASGPQRTHVFNLKRSRDLWTDTVSVTLDKLGGYTLEVVVKDTRGAEARWSDQVAAFDPRNRPPTLKVALQPVAYNQTTQEQIVRAVVEVVDPDGDEVTLNFGAYDEEGRAAHKEIKLYSSREAITKTFSFYEPGTYTLSVQASDGKAAAQWRERVTIPQRQSQSGFPTLQVSSASGYSEDSQQHSIGATARIRELEDGDAPAVYFQLYDNDGRVGEMRVKLNPSDGTASHVFYVSEPGTYELKVVTQVHGRNLQWSNAVEVREPHAADPNEPADVADGSADPNGGAGDDFELEPAEFIPDLTPREDGTMWLAPDDDGFVDPGSVEKPPLMETVTYFDRPWMPQSWKTSGDSRQTRVHIFSTGSRLGWAAALARHAGAPANGTIIEHLEAASIHVKSAYDNSFMPSKAWPDWQQIQHRHESWARQLKGKAGRPGEDTYRRQLAGTFQGHARSLAEKVAYQGTGSFEARENCDSYYCRIGYALACGVQTMRLAMEGQANGMDELWVRRVASEGRSQARTAIQHIRALSQVKPASGFCIDLTFATATLEQATQGSTLTEAKAQAAAKAWEDILAALGGGRQWPPDELAGAWVFTLVGWGQYGRQVAGGQGQPPVSGRDSDMVAVQFEQQGNDYVGRIARSGMVPVTSDAWTHEQTGRARRNMFKEGLEYMRMKKVGKNVYEGTILGVGTPGDNRLTPKPCTIAVYSEAAKFLEPHSASKVAKDDPAGLLLLRDDGGSSDGPDMEAIGRHVFAGMEAEVPTGASITSRGKFIDSGATSRPAYSLAYKKPFRFGGITDNNPGFGFYLIHGGSEALQKAFLRASQDEPNWRVTKTDRFERHGGSGLYYLAYQPSKDVNNIAGLLWTKGDWTIRMFGVDYPNHPGTMFGGHQGQLPYMLRVLDRLVQRLDTIPLTGGLQSPAPPPQTPAPQRSPGGMELLGIESN
jgi:hypothetical protein